MLRHSVRAESVQRPVEALEYPRLYRDRGALPEVVRAAYAVDPEVVVRAVRAPEVDRVVDAPAEAAVLQAVADRCSRAAHSSVRAELPGLFAGCWLKSWAAPVRTDHPIVQVDRIVRTGLVDPEVHVVPVVVADRRTVVVAAQAAERVAVDRVARAVQAVVQLAVQQRRAVEAGAVPEESVR